jgi:hypothetical protein
VEKLRCQVSLGQRRGRQNSDDRQQHGDSRVLAVANLNFHSCLHYRLSVWSSRAAFCEGCDGLGV